jgi:hypothetical protein
VTSVIPVALVTYRRPDLVERALASLKANNVPLVYAWSDGPRDASVAQDVEAVRAQLRAVDWTDIRIVEHPQNLGVADAVYAAINGTLEKHDSLIVCEEDLEFVPGTYAWLCAALTRYRNSTRVMGVAAWNHPRVTPGNVTTDPYFSGRTTSLMWGTWRRAWAGVMDTNCAKLVERCRASKVDPAEYGEDNVNAAIHEFTHGMWDHRFNLHVLAQRGLFLWPARSMVKHNGYDPRATNSPNGAGWELEPQPAPDPATVRWPEPLRAHPASAPMWRRTVAAPPPPTFAMRVRRKLRRLLGGS